MNVNTEHHIEENIKERSDEMWNYKCTFPKQNFAVLSLVEADGETPPAVKIYGTFNTESEANKASKKISEENDFYDVYVADLCEWLPIMSAAKYSEDTVYQEERMNKIKEGYALSRETKANAVRDTIKKNKQIAAELDSQKETPSVEEITDGVEESKN